MTSARGSNENQNSALFSYLNMQFTTLTQRNIKDVRAFLEEEETRNCEYSFGTKEMWRRAWHTQFAFVKNSLVFKEQFGKTTMFYCPLGADKDAAFCAIEDYCAKNDLPLLYTCVPEEALPVLTARYGAQASVVTKRDWCDYLYLANDLKTFPGKKFQNKRNHLNKYKKTYGEPDFHIATEDEKDKLLAFYDAFIGQTELNTEIAQIEAQYAREVLSEAWEIGLTVGYVQNSDGIVALCVGEVRRDTLYVHIEKALYGVTGAYQAIVSEFAKAMCDDTVQYINREDDAGDEGLRISKTRYNPVALLNKYRVAVDNAADRLYETDKAFESERLTYKPFTLETAKDYVKLATDQDNNTFWGYDYTADLNGKEATAEYFWSVLSADREAKQEFSFAVTEKNSGVVIGEVVAHQFDGAFGCEIGARILREYHGHGYGKEAFGALAERMMELGIKTVRAKRYLQNIASQKMIEKNGFTKVDEDDEFVYYQREEE